ncbi:MAG: hypothetical protein K0R17_2497 [Rariglobus sp.]|jgi:hypothetical protein|nr:hypothetical protein [Rariglobus sp.]
MKYPFVLLLLGLCAVLPLPAQTIKLSLNNKGVVVDAGALGKIVVPPPEIATPDEKKVIKPTYTLDGSGGALATYPDGFVIRIAVSDASKTITYAYDRIPEGAASFKFSTLLPINLNQGGRFVLGDKQGEFPVTLGDAFFARGDTGQVDIIYPLGAGIRFSTPTSFQQLQDNRTWNWNVFVWVYYRDLKRYNHETSFTFTVSPVAAKVSANGEPTARPVLVDRFGQSARVDYPWKVKSEDDLKADIEKQKAALGAYVGPALDRFGGLAGSGEKLGLKKTGFFHTAVIGSNRHILVTPEGNAFFQLGVCGIANTNDYTVVKGREAIYEWLPASGDPAWTDAWFRKRPDWGFFSFQIANWIRKFGKPYSLDEWTGQAAVRLRAWGFNSAGAFSSYTRTLAGLDFPATLHLPEGREEGVTYLPDKLGAGAVIDPFAPGVEAALDRAYAGIVKERADSPLIIGYFLGNEQHFENLPKLVLTYDARKVAAKARLVGMLREKYGDIAAFNAAWNPATPFASFDTLGHAPLFLRTEAAAADMRAFLQLYLESYYALIRRVFKKYDSNHLLVGSRLTPHTANNADVVRIGGKYLDVVSVNYYSYGVEDGFLRKIHEWSGGRPLILSEWHFGSTEQGLGAFREVKNQAERGLGYRNYVEQAAALDFVVGSQWYVYADQSITGRYFEGFNGEGNNTGFVDVTDRPYEPLVAAARLTHSRVYDVVLGRAKAFAYDDPRFSGKGAGAAKVVSIPRALPGLQVDGSGTNWPGRPAEFIDPKRLALGNPNPALGGAFRLCWDDEALHFLIQVKDPTPGKNDHKPRRFWSADAVELFVAAKNLDEGGGLQFGDRQILVGAGATPGINIIDNPEAVALCRVVSVPDVSGEGYTLQVRLPWPALGFRPEAGMELLFDVAIDNSDDGETRAQQIVWSGTAKNSGDRASWGRARLVVN